MATAGQERSASAPLAMVPARGVHVHWQPRPRMSVHVCICALVSSCRSRARPVAGRTGRAPAPQRKQPTRLDWSGAWLGAGPARPDAAHLFRCTRVVARSRSMGAPPEPPMAQAGPAPAALLRSRFLSASIPSRCRCRVSFNGDYYYYLYVKKKEALKASVAISR